MVPVQNKALLILSTRRSEAEVTGRNVIMLNCGACAVGRAEYRNAILGRRSVHTAEGVGTRR